MPTLHVTGVAKAHGAQVLFSDVSFRLGQGERLALVGRNGSGKTTLLRILAGEIAADAGDVARPRGVRIALHDQRPPRERDLTLRTYVSQGLADVYEIEQRLQDLERRMAGGAHDDATLRDYARAQADLDVAGGYEWRSRIESILRGLGFAEAALERSLATFSGGELTRASLARALCSRPDVLLLDEPTNHLDIRSLEWLEREVAELPAGVIMVSHDRWFLESTANGVLELERGRSRLWPVRYSQYRRDKLQAIEQQADAFERQQEELQRLQRFVDKFRAGTRSRQAKSVEKRLDRIERVDRPRGDKALAFGFPKSRRPAQRVIEADGLVVRAGDKLLLDGAELVLDRGVRAALIGPNGAGKTTLIETLLGRLRPERGRVKLGLNVDVAYFTQHAEELPDHLTLVEAMCMGTPLSQQQARTMLGRFLFSGDAADKKVHVLSGGERRRLSLARLVSSGANLLVLDEPTNHLDVESREALEDALEAFDGTILMVSHDRALIDAVATETISVEELALVPRLGDYNDYLRAVAARDAAEAARARPPAPPAKPAPKAARQAPTSAAPAPAPAPARAAPTSRPGRKPSQRLVRRVEELERAVARLEGEIAAVETDLADPAVLADRDLLGAAAERHRALQEELAWKLRDWEEAAEALETGGG